MKRPFRARPALEQLEDRWCPSYMYSVNHGAYAAAPTSGSVAVGGTLSLLDTNANANLSIVYEGASGGSTSWQVTDNNPSTGGTVTYTGVTSLLEVTGASAGNDTLSIDGNLGAAGNIPITVSVALDGVAGSGASPNTFDLFNANINNNAGGGTLYVLGQGHKNTVNLGGTADHPGQWAGVYFTNITFRDDSSGAPNPNTGTPNDGSNTTNFGYFATNSLTYNSQSPSAVADVITMGVPSLGSTGLFKDFGGASFQFPSTNNFQLNMPGTTGSSADNFIGSTAFPSASFTVLGGGPFSLIQVGGGGAGANNAFGIATRTTVFDLDDTSGNRDGTVRVNAGAVIGSSGTERFDDYGAVILGSSGGTATLKNPLTIWTSDGGSIVTVGGNVSGNVTFNTGVIPGDSDDPGNASASDTFTVANGVTLSGSLTANLNTANDTVDVEGHVTKAVTVNGGSGNQTVTVESGAAIDAALTFNITGGGFKELDVYGTLGLTGSTATNLSVTTSSGASGATVFATLGIGATVNGRANLSLGQSGGNNVDFQDGAHVTLGLVATANSLGPTFNFFHHHSHTMGTGADQYFLFGSWTDTAA